MAVMRIWAVPKKRPWETRSMMGMDLSLTDLYEYRKPNRRQVSAIIVASCPNGQTRRMEMIARRVVKTRP